MNRITEKVLNEKCEKIKVVLTDVDGVLTDGGMYYSNKGDFLKKFNAHDGMGVNILRRNGIPTIIVTKEKTSIVQKWAENMKVKKVYDGILKKESIIDKVIDEFGVKSSEMAFIGDDVNDLGLMCKVGFSATPKDGIKDVKKIADYICNFSGGNGAFREFADLIIFSKFGSIKLY